MNRLLIAVFALIPLSAVAGSLQCTFGVKRCIKSQGTEIPSSQAIEILDRCREFIGNDLGRVALTLSYAEIDKRSSGRLTPLALAWHAYGDLYDSPLAFQRKSKAEDVNYGEIKRACQQLERDYFDNSKWTE